MKKENCYQTLGQFTSVHFPDVTLNFYDIKNILKLVLDDSEIKFITNVRVLYLKTQRKWSFYLKMLVSVFLKGSHLHMPRNEVLLHITYSYLFTMTHLVY